MFCARYRNSNNSGVDISALSAVCVQLPVSVLLFLYTFVKDGIFLVDYGSGLIFFCKNSKLPRKE